ncbi:MAG: hypothetical protein AB7P04_02085 [Bacteriovoracia bacterium]
MKTRRNIFLINKKFQLRFSFYVCSWLLVLSLVYPLLITNLFESFVKLAKYQGDSQLVNSIAPYQAEVMNLLIWLEVAFLAVTFLISIFISHKIAGPIYKLQQFFLSAQGGQIRRNLKFRKYDHFQELADGYNVLIDGIDQSMNKKVETVSTAIARIENAMKGVDKSGQAELEAVVKDLKELRQNLAV